MIFDAMDQSGAATISVAIVGAATPTEFCLHARGKAWWLVPPGDVNEPPARLRSESTPQADHKPFTMHEYCPRVEVAECWSLVS